MVFPFSFLWCIFLIASDFFIHPLFCFLIAYCLYFFFSYFSFCTWLIVSYYCCLKKWWKFFISPYQFTSVHSLSHVRLQPHWLQHTRPPCPSSTLRVFSNSYPSSQWCHPKISSSVISFTSCLQSFPAWESFQMSQFFASGGKGIGASALTSVCPLNIQDWFPSGWTGWIFLQSKGLSRVFSNTTVQKHKFVGSQLS